MGSQFQRIRVRVCVSLAAALGALAVVPAVSQAITVPAGAGGIAIAGTAQGTVNSQSVTLQYAGVDYCNNVVPSTFLARWTDQSGAHTVRLDPTAPSYASDPGSQSYNSSYCPDSGAAPDAMIWDGPAMYDGSVDNARITAYEREDHTLALVISLPGGGTLFADYQAVARYQPFVTPPAVANT
jgi:hypothetical protein